MAVSKVILNGDTLMDVTNDTVSASSLKTGITATDAAGESITGTHTDPMANGTGTDSVISVSLTDPNTASGNGAFAVGKDNEASGNQAVAMGYNNLSTGISSVAIGGQVSGKARNQATQAGAIAIGQSNQSSGYYSIALGREAVASGVGAVAMGYGNTASGNGSLAAGGSTVAGARCSAALGNGTNANGGNSFVAGKYNVIDTAEAAATTGEREFAVIVGNGTDDNNRSNAMTLDWDGNLGLAGGVSTDEGDVDTRISAKADKVTEITVSTAGAVTQALDAGKIYHFTGALTDLTVTLNAPASGDLAQYHFDFLSGSTAPTLTMPNTVTMPDSFTVEAGKRYEIDVLNNCGAVVSWAT